MKRKIYTTQLISFLLLLLALNSCGKKINSTKNKTVSDEISTEEKSKSPEVNSNGNTSNESTPSETTTTLFYPYSSASDGILTKKVELNFDFSGGKTLKTYNLIQKIKIRQLIQHDSISLDANSKKIKIHDVKINGETADFKVNDMTIDISLISSNYSKSYSEIENLILEFKIEKIEDTEVLERGNGTNFLTNSSKTENEFIITFTQPVSARDNFVTNNRPSDKALYESTYLVPKDWKVLSNGRLLESKIKNELGFYRWKMNQPISSYLFSFAMGDYMIQEVPHAKVQMKNWLPKNAPQFLIEMQKLNSDLMTEFTRLLGPYPYDKYDSAFHFASIWRATEHASNTSFGYIVPEYDFYKDQMSFFDGMYGLIAHELAHQWFGNLVTCKEWKHVWVNEGFASFMETIFYKKLVSYEDHLNNIETKRQYYLNDDSEGNKPPIVVEQKNPRDNFNSQVYDKSSLIIYQLYIMIGEEKFFETVRLFFKRHYHKSATTEDFRAVLEEVTGKNYKQFFDQWFYQPGYPTLNIQISTKNENTIVIEVEQTQISSLFNIPLTFRVFNSEGKSTDHTFQVGQKSESFELRIEQKISTVSFDPEGAALAQIKLTMSDEFRLKLLDFKIIQSGLRSQVENLKYLFAQNKLSKEKYKELILNETKAGLYKIVLLSESKMSYGDDEDLAEVYLQNLLKEEERFNLISLDYLTSVKNVHTTLKEKFEPLFQKILDPSKDLYKLPLLKLLGPTKDPRLKEFTPFVKTKIAEFSDFNGGWFQTYIELLLNIDSNERSYVESFVNSDSIIDRGRAALALVNFYNDESVIKLIGESALIELGRPGSDEDDYLALGRMVKSLEKIGTEPAMEYIRKIRKLNNLPEVIRIMIDEILGQNLVPRAFRSFFGVSPKVDASKTRVNLNSNRQFHGPILRGANK